MNENTDNKARLIEVADKWFSDTAAKAWPEADIGNLAERIEAAGLLAGSVGVKDASDLEMVNADEKSVWMNDRMSKGYSFRYFKGVACGVEINVGVMCVETKEEFDFVWDWKGPTEAEAEEIGEELQSAIFVWINPGEDSDGKRDVEPIKKAVDRINQAFSLTRSPEPKGRRISEELIGQQIKALERFQQECPSIAYLWTPLIEALRTAPRAKEE